MVELKVSKIDPYNCSLEDLKHEIDRLKSIVDEYNGLQHSIKILLTLFMVLVHLHSLSGIIFILLKQ